MATEFAWSALASIIMVTLTVVLHYEALRLISDKLLPRLRLHPRHAMIYVMFGVFLAHTAEVWLFAACYDVMVSTGIGRFSGHMSGYYFDYLYFSVVCYTSLGFGDIFPFGGLRMITGVEALCGLLMIGWSASFTYLCMERMWKAHVERIKNQRHGQE
ncbi:MAG TPA: potassium channel family protein [Moraxellaceae bacterium]|nr:potassium channel family protein [Moraxellaceae bacterium]